MAPRIHLSIGHGSQEQGATALWKDRRVSEWTYNHHIMVPLLREAFAGLEFIVWDAYDHPAWGEVRGRKGSNLLLLDRLVDMFITDSPNKAKTGDIIIDLHNNASRNVNYGGHMVIYRKKEQGTTPPREVLAKTLEEELATEFPKMKKRGYFPDIGGWVDRNLAFLRWATRAKTHAVIVEFGFLTCQSDLAVLFDTRTPKKYAAALRRGVDKFIQTLGDSTNGKK